MLQFLIWVAAAEIYYESGSSIDSDSIDTFYSSDPEKLPSIQFTPEVVEEEELPAVFYYPFNYTPELQAEYDDQYVSV